MRVTTEKNCYCRTCKKWYHYLGITMHRLGHKNREEKCTITFTYGDTRSWDYSNKK